MSQSNYDPGWGHSSPQQIASLEPQGSATGTRAVGFVKTGDSAGGGPSGGGLKQPKGGRPAKKGGGALKAFVITLSVLLVIALAVGLAAFSLLRSYQDVAGRASGLPAAATALVDAVQSGDAQAIASNAAALSENIGAISSQLDGPLWRLAQFAPSYGADVAAARSLASAARELAAGVLDPAAGVLAAYPRQSLVTQQGLNGEAVRAYCALVPQIAPTVQRAAASLRSIESPHFSQINDAVSQLAEGLAGASGTLGMLQPVASSLPDMLGCNGERVYLVVAMNNAQLRSAGGVAGAIAPIHLADGALGIGSIESPSTYQKTAVGLTQAQRGLIEPVGMSISDATALPDFARAGAAIAATWDANYSTDVDGVVAMDPVLLQSLLEVLGDVALQDGSLLTRSNAAAAIMHDSYVKFDDPKLQDAYFASIATAVLDKVLAADPGSIDLGRLLDLLKTGAADGRLLIWLESAAEQSLVGSYIDATGALPGTAATPVLGVYLNDVTGGKMDWWLSARTTVLSQGSTPGGEATYQMQTVIANTASWEEIEQCGDFVLGSNPDKIDRGDMMTYVYLMAPEGGTVADVAVEGEYDPAVNQSTYDGRAVAGKLIHTAPGEADAITYTVTVAAQADAPLQVHTTPTAQGAKEGP